MSRISLNNVAILAGAALVILCAIAAQVMLAAPAGEFVVLG